MEVLKIEEQVALLARLQLLETQWQQYLDESAAVLSEKYETHPDTLHCSCVLHLRRRLADMEKSAAEVRSRYVESIDIIRQLKRAGDTKRG